MTTPELRFARWRMTGLIVWTSIGVLVLLAAALWVFGLISSAFVPFVMAFVVVFLLNAPVKFFETRGMKRGLASGLSLALGIGFLALIVTVLVPIVGKQAVSFADKAPQFFNTFEKVITLWQGRFSALEFQPWLTPLIKSGSTQLTTAAVTVGNSLAGTLVSASGGVASAFFDALLALIIAFWTLRDMPKIREEIGVVAGPRYRDDVEHMTATVTRVVGGYLKGQTIASICTGTLATIGLAFIVPAYAITLGLITGLLNFIPYIGPVVAGALAALVAIIVNPAHPVLSGVLAIVVVIVAQNLTDTLVTPRVMSEQVDLHPTLVIFSLLVGGTLFGIAGMLFAIPVAATAKGLFVYYFEQRTDRQITTDDGALFRTSTSDPDDESDNDCEPPGSPTPAAGDDTR